MKSSKDTYKLHNGVEIPIIGFGTWQIPNNTDGYNAILEALKSGYRHIDSAAAYQNEEMVGKAFRDSKLKREDVFITTKLKNDDHGYNETLRAFQKSLNTLKMDYVDLYLIHWPEPQEIKDSWKEKNAGTWKAMEELYNAGKIRSIGISNFMKNHITELMKTAKIKPMVNQIRLCPGDTKDDLVAFCKDMDIVLEAYSPLATARVLNSDKLKRIANIYNTDVARLALRWSLQNGFVPLPKSMTPERIKANGDVFGFEISKEDMNIISKTEDY